MVGMTINNMAKPNTYDIDKVDGYCSIKNCIICDKESSKRVFYNPTFMNGDAEWLGDYCNEHSNLNWIKKIENKEIIGKYNLD